MFTKTDCFFLIWGKVTLNLPLLTMMQCRLQFPTVGTYKGFNAATLGHLEKTHEAKFSLEEYLALRPNLRKKSDCKKIFVPNSTLGDILIEGLIKAGWEPEEET